MGLGEAHGPQQTAHDDFGVYQIDQLETCRAQGDGNGNGQQLLDRHTQGLDRAALGVQECGDLAVLGAQIEHGDDGTHGDAQNGTAGGQNHVAGAVHDEPGRAQADEQLAQRFIDLRNGGGGHVALTLEEAAVRGDNAHKEHGGR